VHRVDVLSPLPTGGEGQGEGAARPATCDVAGATLPNWPPATGYSLPATSSVPSERPGHEFTASTNRAKVAQPLRNSFAKGFRYRPKKISFVAQLVAHRLED